jgi:hypothetical protein
MVGIKYFEMPMSCESCEMCSCRGLGIFYCDITKQDVDIESDARDIDCPLVEIKENEDDKD